MQNNFDAVRLALALIVVCAHMMELPHHASIEALRVYRSLFSSEFAVKGFFTISGFLVMQSYIRSESWKDYAEKRLRRIYPAYGAAILFCLLIGASVSHLTIGEFLTSAQTYNYLASNLIFLNFLQPELPGVFTENSYRALNGALWTIKVEVCLYFCVPFLWWLFGKIGKWQTTLLCYATAVIWAWCFTHVLNTSWSTQLSYQFPAQLSYFGLGAFFATEPREKPYILPLMLISGIIYWLKLHPLLTLAIEPLFFSAAVIILATQTRIILQAGKYGDLSYGIYLLHFPIIQLMVHAGLFEQNAWLWSFFGISVVAILAWISWHLIEKPLLRRNSHYIEAEEKTTH